MRYFRIYSDEYGQSHFKEMELRFAPKVLSLTEPALMASEPQEASQLLFVRFPPGWSTEWHPAPAYQYVCVLSGEAELTVGDGDTRRFAGGDILHLQDITGDGHTTRVDGDEQLLIAVVQQA